VIGLIGSKWQDFVRYPFLTIGHAGLTPYLHLSCLASRIFLSRYCEWGTVAAGFYEKPLTGGYGKWKGKSGGAAVRCIN
jgi:hypothetical protein